MTLDEDAFRAGYRINSFEQLRSTNDEALRRATLGDRGRLWIVAASQTGGRGRHGRSWASPPGNVYASLLLVDAVPPALAPQLGLVAGVAAVDALQTFAGEQRIALKWPNDVLVGGAKLGGILVEGSRLPSGAFACIVGFGINRASAPGGTPYRVTDLFAVTPARPSPEAIVAALSGAMHRALVVWDEGRGFERTRQAWLGAALPPGTPLSVSWQGRRTEGRFASLDAQGRLILSRDDGDLHIEAGDVTLAMRPEVASGEAG